MYIKTCYRVQLSPWGREEAVEGGKRTSNSCVTVPVLEALCTSNLIISPVLRGKYPEPHFVANRGTERFKNTFSLDSEGFTAPVWEILRG